jgi:hypothetical protein
MTGTGIRYDDFSAEELQTVRGRMGTRSAELLRHALSTFSEVC